MIPADVADLLEPLERFEAIRRKAVRHGPRLVDLSRAEPCPATRQRVLEALRETLADERHLTLQETPVGGRTLARRAIADALVTSHGLPFSYHDVVLTLGAPAGLELACRATGMPGDEVVIPFPCPPGHPLRARHAGRAPVMVAPRGDRLDLDVDAVAEAIGPRTCALLLADPSDPVGHSLPEPRLRELVEAVRRRERELGRPITVIADESHRDFADPGAFTSLTTAHDRTLVAYSFGDYHSIQGQRLGYIAVSPDHPEREELADELVRWARITGAATPTALMQAAVPRLLALPHDLGRLRFRRVRLVEELAHLRYRVVPADGTAFVYVATPGSREDFGFLNETARRGLLTLPAPVFHHRGHFRIALGGSERALDLALPILKELAP